MTSPAILTLSSLLSAAIAVTVVVALQPAPEPENDAAALARAAELAARQNELEQQLALVQAQIREGRQATPRTPAQGVTDEQIAAAVARYLEARGDVLPTEAAGQREDFHLERTFAELLGTNVWNDMELWRAVHEAGRFDEVIERFRQHSKANPDDPNAQVELASALLARLQFEPEKWPLAVEADQAYDRALELDESHWPARFSKAVSYTFWPDFLGKKQEAIGHFETLIQQQESSSPQPHFAQTYLFLGNLYEQRGDTARAREIWTRGSRLYPQAQELLDKLR